MFISDLAGIVECLDFEEYRQQLRKKLYSGLDNEVHLYMRESTDRRDMDHPCTLSILIKGDQAVVDHFSEGNEEISASIGDMDREDAHQWRIGTNEYSVAGYQILSIEKALECALQFFGAQERPDCIKWEEL